MRVLPVDQDVARLQRAVPHARGRRTVEGIGEMTQTRQRIGDRRRSVLAQRDIQRLAGASAVTRYGSLRWTPASITAGVAGWVGPLLERSQPIGNLARDFRETVQLELFDDDGRPTSVGSSPRKTGPKLPTSIWCSTRKRPKAAGGTSVGASPGTGRNTILSRQSCVVPVT